MKKIDKLNREIPYDAYHLRDKINELVDAVNEMCFGKQKEEPRKEEINQCDGCRRGIPIKDGVHQGNSVWDLQACTKDKYEPSLAERLGNNPYFGKKPPKHKKTFQELTEE